MPKISELDAASTLDGTEIVPVVQSGATKGATIDQIADYQATSNDAAMYRDVSGNHSISANAWEALPIDTEVYDGSGIASVASNKITLDAGTYRLSCNADSYRSAFSVLRLYDETAAAEIETGMSTWMDNSGEAMLSHYLVAAFTLSVQSVLRVDGLSDSVRDTNTFLVTNTADLNDYVLPIVILRIA